MLAVFTWLASTLVFQSVYVSDVVLVDRPGTNKSSSVRSSPIIHTVCSQPGGLRGGGGCGGSRGGPDFAGLDRCTWNDDIGFILSRLRHLRSARMRSRRGWLVVAATIAAALI